MINESEQHAFSDLLQALHVQLLVAHKTQVPVSWAETNSVPAYNKLYFIREGEGWIRIGENDYYPKAGQLFLTPAHTQVSFAALNDRPYLKYWCHFTVTAGPFDLFQWIGVPLCIDVQNTDQMSELFQEMIMCYHQQTIIARLREKALLLEIIALFLDASPIQILQRRSEEMNRLHLIQQFVESRLHTTITIDLMAEAVHLHPNYFISYFKKHFGVPPLKYISRKRTDRAKLLLTTTGFSIKEIAACIGFKDTHHFSKFFRKETSLSPTEYRSSYS